MTARRTSARRTIAARLRARWALAAALLAVAVAPASAQAHAIVESTAPPAGAGLDESPASVAVNFNEPVEVPSGALRVLDADGHAVQVGASFHPSGAGSAVSVRLPKLPRGTYTVTYLVTSADSHPVSGGFTFGVGAAPTATGALGRTVDELVRERTAGPVTAVAFSTVRAAQYAAIALAGGAVAFLLACWLPGLATAAGASAAWERSSEVFVRRTRWLLGIAAIAGIVSAVLAILLEGAQTRGTTLWGAASADVLADVFATRYGTVWEIALVCWILVGVASAMGHAAVPRLQPTSLGATGLAPAARDPSLIQIALPLPLLCLLPSLTGHTGVDSPVALLLPANYLHVAAMAVWLGGIATLVVAVRGALGPLEAADRTRLLVAVVPRFSVIAGAAFAALFASGVLQSLLEIPRVSALWETAYGRAVAIKVILFGGLVALGWINRSRSLPGLRAAGDSPVRAARLLRRTLTAELALGVAVVAVTGALAGYPPDPAPLTAAAATGGAFSGQGVAGPARVGVALDATRPGPQRLRIGLTDRRTGRPYRRAKEVQVTAELPAKGIRRLALDVRRTARDRFVATGALAVPGPWRVTVDVRVSDFDAYDAHITVPIASPR